MGGFMGGPMYAWMLLYGLLGLLLIAGGGFVILHVIRRGQLSAGRRAPDGSASEADEAQAALRLRYARGEISREEYLQGKVELED